MNKRQQREIERRAKRLGQLLSGEEYFTRDGTHPMDTECQAERKFLMQWVSRNLAEARVFTQPGMWK